MRAVEQRAHFGVLTQQALIEMGDQCLAAGFKQRNGGLDNGALFGSQHANSWEDPGMAPADLTIASRMPGFVLL
ncbi:hypothetical protein D3C85_1870100 [compost metagenome]